MLSALKSSWINSGINILFKRRLTGEIYLTLKRNKYLAKKAVTLLTLYPTICGTKFKANSILIVPDLDKARCAAENKNGFILSTSFDASYDDGL